MSAPLNFRLSNRAKAEVEEADRSEARLLSVTRPSDNLVGAVLNGVSVRSCHLDGADLSRASVQAILSITESTMRSANLHGFRARCAFIPRSDIDDSDFSQPGDPPQSMALNRANFEEANLVQPHIAARTTGC
nr:pentapeptide repeat-containing protein [Bradyrhizobium yuanmingense]